MAPRTIDVAVRLDGGLSIAATKFRRDVVLLTAYLPQNFPVAIAIAAE